MRKNKTRFGGFYWPILLTLILFFWYLSSDVLQIVDPVLIPSPFKILQVFIEDWRWMLDGLLSSLGRITVAYLIAVPLAVYFGVWAGWIPNIRKLLYPIARVLSTIPPIIYSPFLVALLPSFKIASLTILLLGLFWPTFLNLVHRLDHIEEEIIVPAMMLELNNHEMIHSILLPYVWPGVLTSCRSLLSTSFMLLSFAEMMGADSGLGFYIRYFADYGNYSKVIAGIILTATVILLLNRFLAFIEEIAVPWRPQKRKR